MSSSAADRITSLFLKLLYDAEFKSAFTVCLVPLYAGIVLRSQRALHLGAFLEKVTVQLFNVPQVTCK